MSEPVKEIKGRLVIPYRWSYGRSLSLFFEYTRVEKKLYGARCTKCGGVIVPPIVVCGRCFAPTEKEWVQVGDRGELVAWTTVYYPFPGQPTQPPYTYGYVRLDGANTTFPHLIQEVDPENLYVGMRMEAVWNDDRKGDLYDIKYFRPENPEERK